MWPASWRQTSQASRPSSLPPSSLQRCPSTGPQCRACSTIPRCLGRLLWVSPLATWLQTCRSPPLAPPPSPPSCLLLMLVPVLLLAFCMCLYLSCLLPPACPYACPSAALLLATFCQPVVIQLHTDGPRSARQVCRCATVTIIGLQWSIGLLALSVNAQDALASS